MALITKSRPLYVQYLNVQALDGTEPIRQSSVRAYHVTRTADNVVRDWKQLLATGGNAFTRLYGTDYAIKRSGRCFVVYDGWSDSGPNKKLISGFTSTHDTFVGSHVGSGGLQRAKNLAIPRLIKKINARFGSSELAVAIGEMGETLHMLRGNLGQFHTLTTDYYRKVQKAVGRVPEKWRSPQYLEGDKHFLSKLSRYYLTWAFGVRPLVKEAGDLVSTIESYQASNKLCSVKAGAEVTQGRESKSYQEGAFRAAWTRTTNVVTVCGTRYTGVVDLSFYSSQPHDSAALHRAIGVDRDSFAPTIYELIPYSFIVDYVSNMQDIITAVHFDRRVIKWLARTDWTVSGCTQVWYSRQSSDRLLVHQSLSSSPSEVYLKTVDRYPTAALDAPSFEWENKLTPLKALNLVALIAVNTLAHPYYRLLKSSQR